MPKIKYGMQKPVQKELQQCINSFERMKRGGIGIADELVCDACKRALKYIDELEDKLSKPVPVRHGRWIINSDGYYPQCSECMSEPRGREMTKYCGECGAKMDGDKYARKIH